jgi:glycosyltransferase involved in cell wall biosynthesis
MTPVPSIRYTIIVPFHRNLPFLDRCLGALTPLPASAEILIAADAAVDDCHPLAAKYGARVLDLRPGPSGPAVARNRAAETARGDVLMFIDADVVATPGAVQAMAHVFDQQPDTAAVFGAYDDEPGDAGFVSQYKNLAHAFIHQASETVARTFWAGFGAVRKDAFLAVGGFDERFARPCIEDIDLGYRLSAAGYRIVLNPSLTACHLKRWTLRGMIVSDICDRGIPWTQLMMKFQQFASDLNVRTSHRVCVVIAYLVLLAAGLTFLDARWLLAIPGLLAALGMIGYRYYRYFYRERGLWFALRVFPLHCLYHLYNGVSFATGTALYTVNRWARIELPGALPVHPWSAAMARMAGRPTISRWPLAVAARPGDERAR